MSLTNYALIQSSTFTAAAALASWASVRQGRQEAQERRQPVLLGALEQLKGPDGAEVTHTFLNMLNVGGTAKDVACLLSVGEFYVANVVGPGFLRRQQEATIEAEMPPSSNRRAIWMCRDMEQQVWAWDLKGNAKRYGRMEIDLASNFATLWLDFYGEDLNLLTKVGCKISL